MLFDIDPDRQEPIGKYGEILFRERFPELEFSYTTDITQAYTGMDFVFMQMRAGGLDMYNMKTGEDMMPEIRRRIKENGFLPQDAEQRDQSWLDTYGMVQTIMNEFPEYLPNTYDQYYLYPEFKASHLNPDYTCADEVKDGREKRVFTECAEVIEAGRLGDRLDAISDAHAEMMIKVAESIAYNKNERHIIIVENNGAIANMQDDAMVEVACELGANGPRPLGVGNIPQFHLGLLVNQVSVEKLLVDAFFENSYL